MGPSCTWHLRGDAIYRGLATHTLDSSIIWVLYAVALSAIKCTKSNTPHVGCNLLSPIIPTLYKQSIYSVFCEAGKCSFLFVILEHQLTELHYAHVIFTQVAIWEPRPSQAVANNFLSGTPSILFSENQCFDLKWIDKLAIRFYLAWTTILTCCFNWHFVRNVSTKSLTTSKSNVRLEWTQDRDQSTAAITLSPLSLIFFIKRNFSMQSRKRQVTHANVSLREICLCYFSPCDSNREVFELDSLLQDISAVYMWFLSYGNFKIVCLLAGEKGCGKRGSWQIVFLP